MTLGQAEKLAIRECGRPKRRQIDRQRIVRLWTEPGEFWTQQSIADVCKCSVATVRRVLRDEGFEATYDVNGWGYKIMLHQRADELRRTREK